jgi:hypothetical protein
MKCSDRSVLHPGSRFKAAFLLIGEEPAAGTIANAVDTRIFDVNHFAVFPFVTVTGSFDDSA